MPKDSGSHEKVSAESGGEINDKVSGVIVIYPFPNATMSTSSPSPSCASMLPY